MARVSVKAVARDLRREDAAIRSAIIDGKKTKGSPALAAATLDSFVNFAQKLGIGADNPLSGSTYGFNPISRNRVLLEWIHRGSWLGGVAIDTVADDMTRAGIDYTTELPPEHTEALDQTMQSLNTWPSINEVIKWGRLYGGCLGVVLIDGQDMRTPLNLESVGPGQYRGIMVLDRWMVEPALEDLVTEFGPHLGLPRYYRVTQAAPALRGVAVHHSRVAIRHLGTELPYQQRMVENMWGLSVLERLYDRMIAFDSASTGAAQLVYKAYLRTMSIDGLRDVVSAGNQAMAGLASYVEVMRRFQSMEGITMIDAKDKLEVQGHSAFSGLSDVLTQFGQQLSGALQIPLVRLFGQSPGGLGSNGDGEMRQYYDNINQQQEKSLRHGVTLMYKLGARSKGLQLPPNFAIGFKSLWQLSDSDKANVAKTVTDTVSAAHEGGMISPKTALQELRQSSRVTGIFTNITHQMIEDADDTITPPGAEGLLGMAGLGGAPAPEGNDDDTPAQIAPGQLPGSENVNGTTGQNAQESQVDARTSRRASIQLPPPQRRPTSGSAGPGAGT